MAQLSVLLPNYNNALYLKEALDSVFNQSFQDFIIYFVDDCSTDNSIEIAESFKDDRLIIIRKEKNSGIVDTMNIALDKIETKYFIRMDGDDISTPNRFQILYDYMEKHHDIGVCSSDIKVFGQINEVMKYGRNSNINKANLIFIHSIGHASSIFRTEVFKVNGIKYIDRFWRMEDYYLFYQLKGFTKTISIAGELYLYRKEDYNNSIEIMDKKRLEFYKFYQMIFDDLCFEYTDDNVKMHVQLSMREDTSFSFKDYQNHIRKIVNANQKKGLFPQKELSDVLQNALRKITFKLIHKKELKFKDVLPYFFKDFGVVRYYFGIKFK